MYLHIRKKKAKQTSKQTFPIRISTNVEYKNQFTFTCQGPQVTSTLLSQDYICSLELHHISVLRDHYHLIDQLH